MSGLREQQEALQRAIVNGADDGGVSPSSGLKVYRHAVPARLTAALRDNYLVLHRAMGDEDFDALANAYLQRHPSQQPSIRWFGHRLAEFMAEWEPLAHPALADMARMDWALRDAFDALDAPALHGLTSLDETTRFTLHPSVRLVALEWAVEPAWRVLRLAITEKSEDEPELPEPEAQAHTLLIWRLGLEVRWRSLDALEADLLAAVKEGADFAALGERAAAHAGEEAAPAALVRALQTWLAEGLLLQA